MYFYFIVILIAIVLFTLVVLFLYYNMNSKDKKGVYPPVVNTCPDFWVMDASGRCVVPPYSTLEAGNVGNFDAAQAYTSPVTYGFFDGSGSGPFQSDAIDFRDDRWTSLGGSSLCNQQKWANNYNISWDGVSNYNGTC